MSREDIIAAEKKKYGSTNKILFETRLRLKYLIKQLTSKRLKLDFMFDFAGNENYSYQFLFFWCLLNGRIELAKFFWKHVYVRIQIKYMINKQNFANFFILVSD